MPIRIPPQPRLLTPGTRRGDAFWWLKQQRRRKRRTPDVPTFVGPLDLMESSPILALSTYRLTGTSWESVNGVTDPVARVRRNTDAEEQAFSYLGSRFAYASADAFLGASTGQWVAFYDQSNNGRTAAQSTPANAPSYVTGGSPTFTAAQHLIVPHDATLNGNGGISFAFWMRAGTQTSVSGRILHKGTGLGSTGGYQVRMDADTITLSAGGVVLRGLTEVDDNAWRSVIVTIAVGGSAQIFIDGDLDASGSVGNPASYNTTENLGIAARGDNGGNGYAGDLDNIMIFPGVLSAGDRAILLAMGPPE